MHRTMQPRQNCLNPQTHHHQMVHLPNEQRSIIPQSSVEGLSLTVSYVAQASGTVEYTFVKSIAPDITVWLTKSERPDWFFITEYSSYTQRFTCSCRREGCEHVEDAKNYESRSRTAYYLNFDPCGLGW